MAQEKRLSDTPCSTLEGYGEGPQRAPNGQDSWVFSIFLISVCERMLKIRARSSRDGQVESELLPTAGGIGPDGTVGISLSSTVVTTGIFCCKGVDHGQVIRCRRRRVGARGGTGL